jgi:hypothetical protein
MQHLIEKDVRLKKDTVKHLHYLRTLASDLTGKE